jgi:hypothetical protein
MMVIRDSRLAAGEMVQWDAREAGTILRGFRFSRKGNGIVNLAGKQTKYVIAPDSDKE